jgi:membrane-bound serine protease (ClpP class)
MDSTTALALSFVLIAAGFALLAAEVLLVPSGVCGLLALAGWAVGIVLAFHHDPSTGLLALLAVGAGGGLFFYLWFNTSLGKQMVLRSPEADTTLAETAANQELERLVGRYGRTLSALRPSGIAEFDGRRVDVITEGLMVEPDQTVRCVEVKAGRVVVRPAEGPDLRTLENASFD